MPDQEQSKRGRGRPGTYTNAAERARAWRQRQKALIAQAQQAAEPVIVEKVVEKVIEKVVHVPAPPITATPTPKTPAKTRSKAPSGAPDATRLLNHFQNRFSAYGADRAKRLRSNAARASNTARELLAMFDQWETEPATEKAFLAQVVQFFDRLNEGFEVTQHNARRAAEQAEKAMLAKHETRIKEAIRDSFGNVLDLEHVRATAAALQTFASRETQAAEAQRHGVDRSYFFIPREYELCAALKNGDAARIAREVAEARLEAGELGRTWKDKETLCYSAGWCDFLNYVRTKT